MPRLEPNTIIGGCRIIRELARGGMATIYLAEQESIRREVVLKILSSHLLGDETFMYRFGKEVETTSRLQHPHIIPVYDYGQQGDMPYLIMQYVRGGSVEDLVQKGPVPLKAAVRIVGQVAEALDYAHQEGIIHRDIKPGNILLDGHMNVFLTDFGIARIIADTMEVTSGSIVGTAAYLPPEMLQSGKLITPSADIYSLGCTFYRMVTNNMPFEAETTLQMMWAHSTELVPSLKDTIPDLPIELDDVVRKAMAKTPEARYPSAALFYEDLARILAGEQPLATRDAPPPTDAMERKEPPASHRGEGQQLEQAVARVIDQVVKIARPDGSSGSGILMPGELISTALHVVDGAPGVYVTFRTGERIEADVIALQRPFDLALLRLRHKPTTVEVREDPVLRKFDTEPMVHGEPLAAIGHPLGLEWSVTGGHFNGLREPGNEALKRFGISVNCPLIQVDVAVNPGNSGGPIVDLQGRLVGIADSIINPAIANDIGFGIYAPIVHEFYEASRDAEAALIPYSDGQHHPPGLTYNPTTGKPIKPVDRIPMPGEHLVMYSDGKRRPPGLTFDPATGKPVNQVEKPPDHDDGPDTQRFDPLTGKPL